MKNFTLLVFLLLVVTISNSQNVITVTDASLTGDAHWTADNTYLLDGFVFLEEGTLTIDAGTVIKGKETPTLGDNASALIITTGAKINAVGSAENPIIFTAESDDLSDPADLDATDRGLWGGIILLGKGKLGFNTKTAQIEGIESTEPRAKFGGQTDDDNSGVMKYVSIRHGGAELSPGDEINGLTFGGVGSNTVIEHIEVFANDDDGYEWFGGAVNCKWLISAFNKDDGFDYDFGWRGNGQFWFLIQGTDKADNGGEHDGAKDDDRTPYSKPIIYNATYIGSGKTASGADLKNSTAILFRDNAAGIYANSIFTDFANAALEVEDLAAGVDSRNQMESGELVLKNNIWFGFGAGSAWDDVIRPTQDGGDISFVKTHLQTNHNTITVNPMLRGVGRDTDKKLDPRPQTGSPAWSNLAEYPSSEFFSAVDYKGAFSTENWAKTWTALDVTGILGDVGTSATIIGKSDLELGQNHPNPFSNNTTIEYTLSVPSEVNFSVTDITGKVVRTVVCKHQFEGTHQVQISDLKKGVYFYQLVAGNKKVTKKMIVQ